MARDGGFQALDVRGRVLMPTVLVSLAVFALLAVALYTDLPSLLPGYLAVAVAFVLWCVLPGWFLQRSVFRTSSSNLVEQTAAAFLMSMGLAAIPGLSALRLHWSVDQFGIGYAVFAAVAAGIAMVVGVPNNDSKQLTPPDHEGPFPQIAVLVLIAIPLLAIATSPWWEDGRVARDADDVVYMTYVADYQDAGLNASIPFSDTRRGAFGRMQFNVWVGMDALIGKNAGVDALSLLLTYLPPIMTLLAVAAIFSLAKGLFGQQVALLACAFLLMYGMLDLTTHEGIGRNIFLRIGEDKMVASFVLLPIGTLLVLNFLELGDIRAFVAMLLAMAALFVTHPLGVMFLGAMVIVLVSLRIALDQSAASLRRNAFAIAPWGVAAFGLFLSVALGAGRVEQIGDQFRRGFRITDLPGDLIVANYHLILHPLVLLTLVGVGVFWARQPRQLGTQVMLAGASTALLIMFVPPVATVVANTVNEEVVWRAPWLIPVPLAFAYCLHEAVERIPVSGLRVGALRITRYAGPLIGLLAVGVTAFFVQEHYAILDGKAFYERTSDTSLVPWTNGSIFLGGAERAFSSDWRPVGTERALLDYLDTNAPEGSVVLVPPTVSDRFFAAVLDGVQSAGSSDTRNSTLRQALIRAYYDKRLKDLLPGGDVEMFLDDLGVNLIVMGPRTALDDDFRTFTSFSMSEFEAEVGDPRLTLVPDVEGNEITAWAFDFGQDQRIGQGQFTVPSDMDTSHPTLEFLFDVVDTKLRSDDAEARIVITYFSGDEGDRTNVVTDISAPKNAREGQPFLIRRSVVAPVEAGKTYTFVVSTLPEPGADVNEGLLLTGLRMKYWPDNLQHVGDNGFYILPRGVEGG